MDAWIPITITAAAAQTARFMVQKSLSTGTLSASGATWARFVYSAPVVIVLVWLYLHATGQAIPALGPGFWVYAVLGGGAQIIATVCVVVLFRYRNFAVGIAFKKTEVMLTALVGFLVLGDVISVMGGIAIALGLFAVLWLSDPPDAQCRGIARFLNAAAGIGILSGVFFALSAVGYRGAVLTLDSADTGLKAGLTLAIVSTLQTLSLGLWMAWREPRQIGAVLASWRVSGLVGAFSMIGSFCWFAAFALQNAAYVFALGQVEVAFSILAATLFFGEKITSREGVGLALLTGSILLLVLLG